MIKIGILGGSFDPVHSGHVGLATKAIDDLALSKVLLLPNKIPPHKVRFTTKIEDRLAMLEAAFPERSLFEIERFEIDRPDAKPSFTIDTLKHLSSQYPKAKLVFLIGEDAYAGLPQWHSYPEHLKYAEFWVIPRTLESASEVRDLARQKRWEDVARLVPPKVLDYLIKNNVYDNSRV